MPRLSCGGLVLRLGLGDGLGSVALGLARNQSEHPKEEQAERSDGIEAVPETRLAQDHDPELEIGERDHDESSDRKCTLLSRLQRVDELEHGWNCNHQDDNQEDSFCFPGDGRQIHDGPF